MCIPEFAVLNDWIFPSLHRSAPSAGCEDLDILLYPGVKHTAQWKHQQNFSSFMAAKQAKSYSR